MPAIPDRRLELMLVCAHPAIAPNVRTPLMLQSVLGVECGGDRRPRSRSTRQPWRNDWCGPRNASATRGIPFVLPHREDLAERLPAVLEAVYGAYAIDWQLAPHGRADRIAVAEALHLALVLADLLPDEPEVLGLAALVCLSEARRPARRTVDGGFIPLDEQDTKRWDRALITRGEALLRRAHVYRRPGRFQYEAAIQSAHCTRASGGEVEPERAEEAASRPVAGGSVARGRGGARQPSMARSTGPRRACVRWKRSVTPPSNDSSRPGRPGHICWPRQEGLPKPPTPTAGRSN